MLPLLQALLLDTCCPEIETERELPLGTRQSRCVALPSLICQQELTKEQIHVLINKDLSL